MGSTGVYGCVVDRRKTPLPDASWRDRQIDRQIGRQIDRQVDRQIQRKIEIEGEKENGVR